MTTNYNPKPSEQLARKVIRELVDVFKMEFKSSSGKTTDEAAEWLGESETIVMVGEVVEDWFAGK